MKRNHALLAAALLLAAFSAHAGEPIPGIDVKLSKDVDNARKPTNVGEPQAGPGRSAGPVNTTRSKIKSPSISAPVAISDQGAAGGLVSYGTAPPPKNGAKKIADNESPMPRNRATRAGVRSPAEPAATNVGDAMGEVSTTRARVEKPASGDLGMPTGRITGVSADPTDPGLPSTSNPIPGVDIIVKPGGGIRSEGLTEPSGDVSGIAASRPGAGHPAGVATTKETPAGFGQSVTFTATVTPKPSGPSGGPSGKFGRYATEGETPQGTPSTAAPLKMAPGMPSMTGPGAPTPVMANPNPMLGLPMGISGPMGPGAMSPGRR